MEMGMRLVAMATLVLLAGCSLISDPVGDAQKELKIVEDSNPSKADLCRAHRKLQDAYLQARDAENYKFEKLIADGACISI